MAVRLHGAQRTAAIKQLAGWAEVEDRDAIRKTFHFGSFREAWAFMTEVRSSPRRWVTIPNGSMSITGWK